MVWHGMAWYGTLWTEACHGHTACFHHFLFKSVRMLAHQKTQQLLLLGLILLFILLCDFSQVQYHEANRFRTAASAAAAGAAPGLNEADRAYRQMVADPSSSIHPMLRYQADPICV